MSALAIGSRFIAGALERELRRRAVQALRRSMAEAHPDSTELAETGLAAWAGALPAEDASDLVDLSAGRPVRWTPERGWETIGGKSPKPSRRRSRSQ